MKKEELFSISYAAITGISFGLIEALNSAYIKMIIPGEELIANITNARALYAYLHGKFILWPEQTREISILILITIFACVVGKDRKNKAIFFLLILGLWKLFRYIFLFIMIRIPTSLTEKDIVFYCPSPWVAPAYLGICLSLFLCALSTFLYFYRGVDKEGSNKKASEKKKKKKNA